MGVLRDDAVLAIYLDKDGQEIQYENLTAAAKGRVLQDEELVPPPYQVMTVEISCLSADRAQFDEAFKQMLGTPGVESPQGWRYEAQSAPDERALRYVFDTNFRVPLEYFAAIITTLTKEKPSRCQTVKMVVSGGCIAPCRPKTCRGYASCGYASPCPC